jgi:hypothetical protein
MVRQPAAAAQEVMLMGWSKLGVSCWFMQPTANAFFLNVIADSWRELWHSHFIMD